MNAHAFWYLTRGTGVVSLVLVTAAVVLGILASLRVGGSRTPRFVVPSLHRNLSLLTVAFIVVHVVTTVLDAYAPITLLDAVVPFASPYRPLWLGLGAVAFDLILALIITSLVRVRLGLRTWRGIHWFAYACFPIALVHAMGTGTDAPQAWMLDLVVACTAIVTISMLARLWQIRGERTGVAIAGTVALGAALLLGTSWAQQGPLAAGWAKRAGTPSHLIHTTRATTSASISTAARATLAPALTQEEE